MVCVIARLRLSNVSAQDVQNSKLVLYYGFLIEDPKIIPKIDTRVQ